MEKAQIDKQKKEASKKIDELKKKEADNIENELKKLELEKKTIEEREKELVKAERSAPWNVDTISKESWSKTMFNKSLPREDRSKLTEEQLEKRYKEFVKQYEAKIKEFAMLSKFDDCKSFLMQNQDLGLFWFIIIIYFTINDFLLVCEETSNYMTFWCLNLEIEGKHDLMEYISKQAICLHYILELSKHMDIDPRGCVSAFFTRIQKADKEYMEAFDDEVKSFRERIEARAKKRIEDAMKEVEEEEKQQRLGPGGLDPQEVFETLPEELQKCFESREIHLLQEAILKMDPEEAKYHMKRCVDSGLWVPAASDPEEKDEEENAENTEPIYSRAENEVENW